MNLSFHSLLCGLNLRSRLRGHAAFHRITLTVGVFAACLAATSTVPAAITVYLDRTAWEHAAGGAALTETFNSFSGPLPYQLPPGVNRVGVLNIEVQTYSGNLIAPGNFTGGSVNGTTFWRIEAATQNGPTPPITPILSFNGPVWACGADFEFFFPPRSTMTINGDVIRFSDYIPGARNGFFGVVSSTPFDHLEFDVVSPFNTIFHADNVSFVVVPEPSSLGLVGAILGLAWARRPRR